jgi:Mn-dependent DtxR family transcriptional regulator
MLSAGAAGSMMNLLQMPTFNHRCEITSGVLQKEGAAILQDFIRKRREARRLLVALGVSTQKLSSAARAFIVARESVRLLPG